MQLRLLAERGAHEQAPCRGRAASRRPARAASRRTTRRRSRPPRGCCSPRGSDSRRSALLVELAQVPGHPRRPLLRRAPCPRSCAPRSPSTQPELAARLVDGVEPRTPLAEHALCACRAQLAEAAGDHAEAAALYAEAAERWREFGNVPERAYALLGQGRCLAALGKPEARGAAARGARAVRVDGLQARRSPRRRRCSSERPPPPRKHRTSHVHRAGAVGDSDARPFPEARASRSRCGPRDQQTTSC